MTPSCGSEGAPRGGWASAHQEAPTEGAWSSPRHEAVIRRSRPWGCACASTSVDWPPQEAPRAEAWRRCWASRSPTTARVPSLRAPPPLCGNGSWHCESPRAFFPRASAPLWPPGRPCKRPPAPPVHRAGPGKRRRPWPHKRGPERGPRPLQRQPRPPQRQPEPPLCGPQPRQHGLQLLRHGPAPSLCEPSSPPPARALSPPN
mmetsp:Transcript_53348/g.114639  ORF Transcript_53348/g.114639 Transcript_53348/m.114639 type:complete len:203 (+) Transcript_53348:1868-2476(+)